MTRETADARTPATGPAAEAARAAGFDLALRTRLVFGAGRAREIGTLAVELGARRVLVVTDPGLVRAGHVERVEDALRAAGLEVGRFAESRENPTTLDVERCRDAARAFGPDLLVGLGGGSSIDVAKGAAFLLAGGGRMEDYRGRGKARGRLVPMIAVPTTAGTGSDVQSFALIATEDTHEKMACGDAQAAPRVALLDPLLSLTQPPLVTACTGLDALGHAVETAVTRVRNEVSDLFSARAFRLIARNLPRVLADPSDLDARGGMLLAAAFAGIAIESSMLGAAHSMANPLTARFGVAHGQAVATALPHVVRYNAEEPAAARAYAALAREAGLAPGAADRDAAHALAARVSELVALAGLPTSLAASGVTAEDAPALAREAATQWTARFNPRPIAAPEFETLFRAAALGRPSA